MFSYQHFLFFSISFDVSAGVLNDVLSQGTTSLDNVDDSSSQPIDDSSSQPIDSIDSTNNDGLQNCFAALVNTLSTQNPK